MRLFLTVLLLSAWTPILAQEPAKKAGEESTPHLEADDPLLRHAALRALAERGPAAKDALESVLPLLRDAKPWVRLEAGRTIVAIGAGKPQVRFLVQRLLVANIPLEQVLCVALADVGAPAVKPLVKLLAAEKPLHRRKALGALAYFGRHGAPAIPRLLELMDDRRAAIKRLAAEALRRLGPWAEEYVPELIDALKLGSPQVKFTAARMLAQVGPAASEAVPALKETALSATSAGVKSAAAAALLSIDIQPRKELHPALLDATLVKNKAAPAVFRVKLETTKGDIVLRVTRAWAPHGADRFWQMLRIGFFDNVAFFRVLNGFVAQFGLHGDSRVNGVWRDRTIPDDPPNKPNLLGTIAFAKTNDPNSRATQLFFNLGNNGALDKQGFAPIGEIESGLAVAQALFSGYGDPPGGPDQRAIASMGNEYLARRFPKLDYVKRAILIKTTDVPASNAANDNDKKDKKK